MYMPANSIFDGPITNLLSVLCILVEILSCAHVKRGKSCNDFKFGTSIGSFLSDGAASVAVQMLMVRCGGEVCDGNGFVSGPSVWATSLRTW